jgi:hypothetical protein
MWWTALAVALVMLATAERSRAAGALPREAAEAHAYADRVLTPRFTAAFNDWAAQHPVDLPGREGEHCRKLDAGDVKRWELVRASFRELDAAWRRAGY